LKRRTEWEENKIFTFQEYRNAWGNADKVDPEIPLNLDIELMCSCNLRCPFCFIVDPDFRQTIRHKKINDLSFSRSMDTEFSKSLIDEAANLSIPAIKLNWRGESTLHKDFNKIARYAASKKSFHETILNTNLNCETSKLDGIMELSRVAVSLDSFKPETYADMRVGGDHEKVLYNISELIKMKHKGLYIRRVITKRNFGENFTEDAHHLFGKNGHFKVSEHYCFDRNKAESHATTKASCRRYCGYPSQRLVVASNGIVVPCCIDTKEEMAMQNLRTNSISSIWNSSKLKNLRSGLRANPPIFQSEICKNCESWMAFDSPEREAVKK
jgi:radical SAM protein with 4Fe4S-binding SPASM domain